ncbi:unnamed protein product [Sphenostylis stenocarpa]|uniref:Uncharacterized protein n=1 Tax=Sphenostylis stenocarpa TaxID=92480 RepID=A0AA86SYR4_9FABA|nr:unnamed protein product [Sphenostylis stenocarpa]
MPRLILSLAVNIWIPIIKNVGLVAIPTYRPKVVSPAYRPKAVGIAYRPRVVDPVYQPRVVDPAPLQVLFSI